MFALVLGPTGTAGSELLRLCVADDRFARVMAISRRPLALDSPRLKVLLREQFMDYSDMDRLLAQVDVCFFALGVSQTVERDPARYRVITYDYPLQLARALHQANPAARFCFLSGQGADPTMKSRAMFARVKGEAEKDLRALLRDRLLVYRPGYIHPVHPKENPTWSDRLAAPFVLLRPVLPGLVTNSNELARAMIYGGTGGEVPPLLENRDIIAAAERYDATVG